MFRLFFWVTWTNYYFESLLETQFSKINWNGELHNHKHNPSQKYNLKPHKKNANFFCPVLRFCGQNSFFEKFCCSFISAKWREKRDRAASKKCLCFFFVSFPSFFIQRRDILAHKFDAFRKRKKKKKKVQTFFAAIARRKIKEREREGQFTQKDNFN